MVPTKGDVHEVARPLHALPQLEEAGGGEALRPREVLDEPAADAVLARHEREAKADERGARLEKEPALAAEEGQVPAAGAVVVDVQVGARASAPDKQVRILGAGDEGFDVVQQRLRRPEVLAQHLPRSAEIGLHQVEGEVGLRGGSIVEILSEAHRETADDVERQLAVVIRKRARVRPSLVGHADPQPRHEQRHVGVQ